MKENGMKQKYRSGGIKNQKRIGMQFLNRKELIEVEKM